MITFFKKNGVLSVVVALAIVLVLNVLFLCSGVSHKTYVGRWENKDGVLTEYTLEVFDNTFDYTVRVQSDDGLGSREWYEVEEFANFIERDPIFDRFDASVFHFYAPGMFRYPMICIGSIIVQVVFLTAEIWLLVVLIKRMKKFVKKHRIVLVNLEEHDEDANGESGD